MLWASLLTGMSAATGISAGLCADRAFRLSERALPPWRPAGWTSPRLDRGASETREQGARDAIGVWAGGMQSCATWLTVNTVLLGIAVTRQTFDSLAAVLTLAGICGSAFGIVRALLLAKRRADVAVAWSTFLAWSVEHRGMVSREIEAQRFASEYEGMARTLQRNNIAPFSSRLAMNASDG